MIDEALQLETKNRRLREEMVRDSFMTIKDLAKRWGVSTHIARRAGVPRTRLGNLSTVRFHPIDVLEFERRQRIAERVTTEQVDALGKFHEADDELRELYATLRSIVYEAA